MHNDDQEQMKTLILVAALFFLTEATSAAPLRPCLDRESIKIIRTLDSKPSELIAIAESTASFTLRFVSKMGEQTPKFNVVRGAQEYVFSPTCGSWIDSGEHGKAWIGSVAFPPIQNGEYALCISAKANSGKEVKDCSTRLDFKRPGVKGRGGQLH